LKKKYYIILVFFCLDLLGQSKKCSNPQQKLVQDTNFLRPDPKSGSYCSTNPHVDKNLRSYQTMEFVNFLSVLKNVEAFVQVTKSIPGIKCELMKSVQANYTSEDSNITKKKSYFVVGVLKQGVYSCCNQSSPNKTTNQLTDITYSVNFNGLQLIKCGIGITLPGEMAKAEAYFAVVISVSAELSTFDPACPGHKAKKCTNAVVYPTVLAQGAFSVFGVGGTVTIFAQPSISLGNICFPEMSFTCPNIVFGFKEGIQASVTANALFYNFETKVTLVKGPQSTFQYPKTCPI